MSAFLGGCFIFGFDFHSLLMYLHESNFSSNTSETILSLLGLNHEIDFSFDQPCSVDQV